ncbi:MAG: YbaN family protein [Gammaproteobacteria bacterium]|nr:YbaN family protein [Gammaproteobacteria bacterium]MDC0226384.1 YbaN family protein [Gammaproteobacteria bacterium]|tara:strand:- start:315 stop:731 length:417 start_codon:yes stop_codon:yes gene_type:complete
MNNPDKNIHIAKEASNPIIKALWVIAGSVFVVLGAFGVILPGLPTTPFLILAAACYIRSSQRLYDWLIANKTFGPYLRDYREGKGIPKRAKKIALVMMTIFVGYAVLFALDDLFVRIVVLILGMIGFFYVAYRVPSAK